MAENEASAPVADLNEDAADETFPVEVYFDGPSQRGPPKPKRAAPRPTVDLVEAAGVSFQPRREPRRQPVIAGKPLKQALKYWAKYKARATGDEPTPYNMIIDDGARGVLLHCYKCRCPEGSEIPCAKIDKFTGSVKVQLNSAARTCCSEFPDQCTMLDDSIVLAEEIIDEITALDEEMVDYLKEIPPNEKIRYHLFSRAAIFLQSLKARMADDDDPEIAFVLDAFVDSFFE